MPRKIRQLKGDLQKAGFKRESGKGSHTKWKHPLLLDVTVTISGNDGNDAKPYQEKALREAIKRLEEAKGEASERT